jgi:hypothetical protein
MALGGWLAYQCVVWHGVIPSEWGTNGILAGIIIGPAVALVLSGVHEVIHGVTMLACGVRPQFGVLRRGRAYVILYTSAPGRLFQRNAYLAVALAPLLLLTSLGAVLCWSPAGWLLSYGFGIHLGTCIGDIEIARRVAREPRGVLCEDLQDGVRFRS